MKRFVVSILCVSVFFVGLGALVEKASAGFKSDEKALEIIRAARAAIGGESAVREIRSLVILGKTTRTSKVPGFDGAGDTEIALQLPDKLMKTVKIGSHDGNDAEKQIVHKQVDVEVIRKTKDGNISVGKGAGSGTGVGVEPGGKKIIVKEVAGKDGEERVFVRNPGDGGTWVSDDGKEVRIEKRQIHDEKMAAEHHDAMRSNELLRLTLGLLLTAPDGMDVSYTYAGEGDVDGTAVNIVNASFGGSTYKLFIARSNSLPVGIGYTGKLIEVMHFDKAVAPPADGQKDVVMFKKQVGGVGEAAEIMVRFADFRNTGGVQLPYKWTTSVGGRTEEVFDVTSYDLNPANISEKFRDQVVTFKRKAGGN